MSWLYLIYIKSDLSSAEYSDNELMRVNATWDC